MKKAALRFVLIAIALCLLAGSPAEAQEHKDILDAIQKHYAGLKSIRANYTRITSTPAMEGVFDSTSTQQAEGVMSFKKQAMLHMDQTYPRPEKLITDGKTVWWWIPDEKLVHLYKDVDVYGEMRPLLDFFNGLASLEGRFKVKVTPAGKAPNINHRLDLTRLEDSGGPDSITVWCSPEEYSLVGFKLTSLTGEATVFNLAEVEVDPKLDDKLFSFKIPPGTEVIEEDGKIK